MLKYYFAAFLGVFLTAISQLLFKLGANQASRHSLFSIYTNPYSISAYAMLLVVTLLNVYAYNQLPIKLAVVILSFTYILVGLFSFLFLKEKASRNQLIGAGIIIIGIFIFGATGVSGSYVQP
jgi:drug/metabolite transporter (DMT)-like permease